jgi:hypothetical protein
MRVASEEIATEGRARQLEVTVAEGPIVRIAFPPAASQQRTKEAVTPGQGLAGSACASFNAEERGDAQLFYRSADGSQETAAPPARETEDGF